MGVVVEDCLCSRRDCVVVGDCVVEVDASDAVTKHEADSLGFFDGLSVACPCGRVVGFG